MDDATAERHAGFARAHVRSQRQPETTKAPEGAFFTSAALPGSAPSAALKNKEGNLEGEPQVSPGVASLPVASGVREHIVGIANRFQTQAFMQRYTWFAAPHYRW
ncbi:hypothetical protein [Janthinobacterium sp. ZB1P44]|uniref:hypothetical protein n=1 Tax=Janthinobacterium sp. ZB1P44 TaxID=3424192 RepID=UPI003F27CC46